jgi:hypothetical protein
VASLLEALLDGQMRAGHSPDPADLDPLLEELNYALVAG